jgi:hypothetical protein
MRLLKPCALKIKDCMRRPLALTAGGLAVSRGMELPGDLKAAIERDYALNPYLGVTRSSAVFPSLAGYPNECAFAASRRGIVTEDHLSPLVRFGSPE